MKPPVAEGPESVWNFARMASEKKQRGMRGSAPKGPLPAYLLELPARVRAAREAQGWNQDELARRAGVTQGKISELESGTSLHGIRMTTVVGISVALRTSLDTLLLGKPDLLGYVVTAVAEGRVGPFEAIETTPIGGPAPAPAALPAPKSRKKRQPPR